MAPYYVGSTLDTIGRSMQADRDTEARSAIAQQEQQRLAMGQFLQALQHQQAQEQNQQQFMQELAYRKSAQDQQSQYQHDLLGLRRNELDFSQNGYSPIQSWEQAFRERELASKERVAEMQSKMGVPRVEEERFKQNAISERDDRLAMENVQAENAAAQTKAAEYNALAEQIRGEAKRLKDTGNEWFTSHSSADEKSRLHLNKLQGLIEALRTDTRPGQISPTPDGKFQPVLRNFVPRTSAFGNQPNGFNPVQRFDSEAGANGQTIPAPSRLGGPVQAPVTDKPIRVQTSDGRIIPMMSSNFAEAKQRDPGVKIVSVMSPLSNPSGPVGTAQVSAPAPMDVDKAQMELYRTTQPMRDTPYGTINNAGAANYPFRIRQEYNSPKRFGSSDYSAIIEALQNADYDTQVKIGPDEISRAIEIARMLKEY